MSAREIRNFSDVTFKSLPVPTDKKRQDYWDRTTPGLACRVNSTGAKSYIVAYSVGKGREGRKQRIYTIGKPETTDIEEARQIAKRLILEGRNGIDYAEFLKNRELQRIAEINDEQINVSLFEVGEVKGQFKYDWLEWLKTREDNIKRRYYLDLKNTKLKHLLNAFGETKLTVDVNEDDVLKLKRNLGENKRAFSAIRTELATFFEYLINKKVLTANPAKLVKGHTEKVDYIIFSVKGIKELITFYSDLSNFKRERHNQARFIEIMARTGMRINDLQSLERMDKGDNNYVDFKQSAFVFRKHKASKKRRTKGDIVPVSQRVIDLIKDAMLYTNEASIRAIPPRFSKKPTDKIGINPLYELFNEHKHRFETRGLGEITLYKLRHTFGTHLYESGVPLDQVGALMLHAPGSTTTYRYANDPNQQRLNFADRAHSLFD